MYAAAKLAAVELRPGLVCRQLDSSMNLASEARRLDAQINSQLGNTLSQLTKKYIPRRP